MLPEQHHFAWTTHQLNSGTVLETATPAWRKENSPSIHQPLYDSSGEKYGAGGDLFIQVSWWEEPIPSLQSLHNSRILSFPMMWVEHSGLNHPIVTWRNSLARMASLGITWHQFLVELDSISPSSQKRLFFFVQLNFLFIRTFSLRSSWQLVSSWRMWWVPEFWPCPPPWRTSGYYLEALWNLAALVMDHGAGFSGEMDGHDFGGYTKLDPCTLFWGWRVFRVDWCCVFSAAEKLADYSEGLFA